jgi:hypothetical protein
MAGFGTAATFLAARRMSAFGGFADEPSPTLHGPSLTFWRHGALKVSHGLGETETYAMQRSIAKKSRRGSAQAMPRCP